MATNKNQLREDAVELALLVSSILEKVKGNSVYAERMENAAVTVGATLTSLKNPRDEVGIVRRLNVALDALCEILFAAKVLMVSGKITEETYKSLKKMIGSMERRIVAGLAD